MSDETELASNRKAYHNYEIVETFEAGIVLLGTEIKSLRNHGGNIQEGYVVERGGEAWLLNASIIPYKFGGVAFNHEERRERKLLLHKREIAQIQTAASEKGLTIVPLALYLKKGRVKVKIGIAKGKKLHDKRHAIKDRDVEREMRRSMQK
jgi:SsrA-binding protein